LSHPENNDGLQINKGTELMLRRDRLTTPKTSGVSISQKITLLSRTFHFKLELSWEKKPKE